LKVLILAPAPLHISPSQRFRYEQYIELTHPNCRFHHHAFFSEKTWSILFLRNHFLQKAWGILIGFCRTFLLLFSVPRYHVIYVHRGITPLGPPVFEWLIACVFRKKLIFDFDDAIWVRSASEANPLAAWFKFNAKVKRICSYSHIVAVGNEYLAAYARQYCRDVRIIPTVVDTNNHHNQIKDHHKTGLVIGWTGTFTNFSNLQTILPVINELSSKYFFSFQIIADRDPEFKEVLYRYKQWNRETEIEDLLNFSIGIMPLVAEEMEKGKCAFKAIQYMSLGIPPVVSPVGANRVVVDHGINGFLAATPEEWKDALEKLLTNAHLREEFGKKARQKIEASYSVKATQQAFFDLFDVKA
jgi:glycosyltransferase involved in cell wall biosynthesis